MTEMLKDAIPLEERLLFSTASMPPEAQSRQSMLDYDEYRAWLREEDRANSIEVKMKPYLPAYFENFATTKWDVDHPAPQNGAEGESSAPVHRAAAHKEAMAQLRDAQKGFRVLEDIQMELSTLQDSASALSSKLECIEADRGIDPPQKPAYPDSARSAKLRLIRLLKQDVEDDEEDDDSDE